MAVMQDLVAACQASSHNAFLGSESSGFHQMLQRIYGPEFKEHWRRESATRKTIQESINHPFNAPRVVEPLPDSAIRLWSQSSWGTAAMKLFQSPS